jgi:uncharacterized protein YbaP (TraB family)
MAANVHMGSAVFIAIATSLFSTSLRAADPLRHCVWRVTNVAVPFYLVGSFHNLRGDDYPLPDVYRKALNDSKRLLFEYDPRERELFAKKFRASGKYPPGKDIRSAIRPATLALLIRYLSVTRIRFDDVKDYKPWALALRLWTRQGYAAAVGTRSVDDYLSYEAQRLRKETGGLESVQEHAAFWGNMLEADGENLLLTTMLRGDQIISRFDETRAAWKRGDIAALSETNASLRRGDRQTAQRLLDRRNLKWLPRIEAEMRTGTPTAIVAGAGHFSGAHSVIDLLQKRGYKIEQL